MTNPDMQQLEDLSAAAIASFVMNEQDSYFIAKTHKDDSGIGASEVVILTITREHLPPLHPSPVNEVLAGVTEYVTV